MDMMHSGTWCNTYEAPCVPTYNPSHRATLLVPTRKPRVGLTLEPHVFEELKVIAKAENRSLSNLIESWVLAELQRRRKP
jgi:hypothetical protein